MKSISESANGSWGLNRISAKGQNGKNDGINVMNIYALYALYGGVAHSAGKLKPARMAPQKSDNFRKARSLKNVVFSRLRVVEIRRIELLTS